mgnify:CR=1 FL=1
MSQELPVQKVDDVEADTNEYLQQLDSKPEDSQMTNSLLGSILTQAASHEPVDENDTVKAGEDEWNKFKFKKSL